MKTLVIYYSFGGNTRLLAEAVAKEANADVCEIKVSDELPSTKVGKMLWAGKTVFTTKFPKLEKIDVSFEDYDLIFIGTPVWAFTYAPPFNSFFRDTYIKNKKVAMFCTHGGLKGKVFDKLKDRLVDNTIVGCIDFVEPFSRDKDKHIQNAIVWTRQILEGC